MDRYAELGSGAARVEPVRVAVALKPRGRAVDARTRNPKARAQRRAATPKDSCGGTDMHDTFTFRQDEPTGRRALAFVTVTAAAALAAMLLTTEVRAQLDNTAAAAALAATLLTTVEAQSDSDNVSSPVLRMAGAAYEAALDAEDEAGWDAAMTATWDALMGSPFLDYSDGSAFGNAVPAQIAVVSTLRAGRRLDLQGTTLSVRCAGETEETMTTIVREFPDYLNSRSIMHIMGGILTAQQEFQESRISFIEAAGWSIHEAVVIWCVAAESVSWLLLDLQRGNFESADSLMAATLGQLLDSGQ